MGEVNVLSIHQGKEALTTVNNFILNGDNLFLTGLFLKSFREIIQKPLTPLPAPEEIFNALRDFYIEVTGEGEIIDELIPIDVITKKPIPNTSPEIYKSTMFFLEAHELRQAVSFWLHPKEGPGIVSRVVKILDYTRDFTTCLYQRCQQLVSFPVFSHGELIRLHTSKGILPLCWAEIWFAIENKMKAGICPYCGNVFLFPRYNYQKVHCGRTECKKAHIISQHGGVDDYRQWESERKKNRPPGGKKGRPKKSKEV